MPKGISAEGSAMNCNEVQSNQLSVMMALTLHNGTAVCSDM